VLFPLSFHEISFWIGFMAILLLISSELLTTHYERFGYFLLDKKVMRFASFILGVAFLATVLIRALIALTLQSEIIF
jgi:hypothetical protein